MTDQNQTSRAQQTAPLLEIIQKLQFADRPAAEKLLIGFVNETFPDLKVIALELRPQATSLNSFNGFISLTDERRLFFKTHVESDTQISEYYNAQLLAEAGYPVIQPLYSSTHSGQQLLIYPVIVEPAVFDVARELETAQNPDQALFAALTKAQNKADDQLYQLFIASLASQTGDQAASMPIHQLFYHRLTGGRMNRFYGEDTEFILPDGVYRSSDLFSVQWTINGVNYTDTLDTITERASELLHPAQAGCSIIGHGDAHNGNVFFNAEQHHLTYFDPAFAGRHHPLLDLTKPLFHNVFAMWMYFPAEEREKLQINLTVEGDGHWRVEHTYTINPVRQMFLQSKVERVLLPALKHLKVQGLLRDNWRSYLKSALFCCPFLTLDLKKFPPEIALLGLTMAIEMGAEGQSPGKRSIIDTVLDEVERYSGS